MNCEKIGKFIQTLRKEKNVTQKDLADYLMVTVQAVSKWERGLGFPDFAFLQPIAEYFQISISELLSGERIPPNERLEKADDLLMKNLESLQEKRKKEVTLMISFFLLMIFFFLIFTSNLLFSFKFLLFILITIVIGYLPTIIEKKVKLWHIFLFLVFMISMLGIDFISTTKFKQNPFFYFHLEKADNFLRYDYPFYSIYQCSNQNILTGFGRKNPIQYCQSYYSPNLEKSSSMEVEDGLVYYLAIQYSNQQDYLGKNSYLFNIIDLKTLYEQEFVKDRTKKYLTNSNLTAEEIQRKTYEIFPNQDGIHLFEAPQDLENDITTLQNYLTEKQFSEEITEKDLADISFKKIQKDTIVTLFNEAVTNVPNEKHGFYINQIQNDHFQVVYMIENKKLTHVKILPKNDTNLDQNILEKIEETMIGNQSLDIHPNLLFDDSYSELLEFLQTNQPTIAYYLS